MAGACRAWLCAVLLMVCLHQAVSAGWELLPDAMADEANLAGEAAVEYMTFRKVICGGGTLKQVISASHMPVDEDGNERLFLTMDVDVNGENQVTLAEVHRAPNQKKWQVLVPNAIKNRKSSNPENLTSRRDRWQRVSSTHPVIAEGVQAIDGLLKSSLILMPVDNVYPALSMVRHAELRGRDISSELGELTDIKDTSTQEVEQAKVDIVKLESQLIQTLSVKKLALEDPSTEKSLLQTVDGEVQSLEKALEKARDTEEKGNVRIEKSTGAIKQLNMQESQAEQTSMGGRKVENSRTYIYVLLQYVWQEQNVEKTLSKHVMAYKDHQGAWKLLQNDDHPC